MIVTVAIAFACAWSVPARAEPVTAATRDDLFRQSLKHPRDLAQAFAYAQACVALEDYEGAIGALERVAFYAPDDPHVRAELGLLYERLHSHQMAQHYFDAALAGSGLDGATRAQIAAAKVIAEAATNPDHVFGTLQVGTRYQSNAAFNPDGNLLRITDGYPRDINFDNPRNHGADGNVFAFAQVGYDHDLDNQRGDTIETRFSGYATQQFRFTDLDVGFYDVSIGPRLALAPETLPGWTIKPYVTGGQVFLGGLHYLTSGGGGVVADLPVRPGTVIEPGAEVRQVGYSNVTVFSSLSSGTTATLSLSGQTILSDAFSLSGRLFYTRADAAAGYQSSNNIAEEIAVTARFAAPLPGLPGPWSVSPYVKLLQTTFDAGNPFIDATRAQRDDEIQVGLVLDTPLTERLGIVTNIQYARIASNIPNYRLHNVSVLSGPAVRF